MFLLLIIVGIFRAFLVFICFYFCYLYINLNFFDFLISLFFNFVWKTDKTSWKRKQKLRTWKMGFSRVLNFQSNNKNLFCVSKKKDI